MKWIAIALGVVLLLLCGCSVPVIVPVKVEESPPKINLTIPVNKEHRDYLGLVGEGGGTFSLADIKADVLLIELFSMYCPYCQKEAPRVNELYEQMAEASKKGLTVKIIGIGAGNSQFEVEHFSDVYGIQFPLFPDRERTLYQALSGAGTPYFIGYRIRDGEVPAVILRRAGGFQDVTGFLRDLLMKSGIHKEQ